MKPSLPPRIDKVLGELGLHPDSIDPDDTASAAHLPGQPGNRTLTGICGKSCYHSERVARRIGKAVLSRGANTSFLRPYFCPRCKAWHLTSSKIDDHLIPPPEIFDTP